MQIDKASLDKLLAMNDRQLQTIMIRLAAQSGIDPKEFNIDLESVASIRKALAGATDEDLQKIADQYEANKGKKR
jgi:hypothetical protein